MKRRCFVYSSLATPLLMPAHVERKPKSADCLPVEIKTILVPTDLRPESMIAPRYALAL